MSQRCSESSTDSDSERLRSVRLALPQSLDCVYMIVVRLALAIVLLTLSASPAAARTSVTDTTIDEHADDYEMHIAYPQIGTSAVDSALAEWAQSVASDVKDAAAQRDLEGPPYFAQVRYSIPRNDDTAVSILFSYSLYTGGAHPNSVQIAFNFLQPDGARIFLPELAGEDGIQRISDIAIASLSDQLSRPDRLSVPELIRRGAGPFADNFDTFDYLPGQIVLHFDPEAVAGYAAGPQQVRIPLVQLEDTLRPDPRAPLPSFPCTAAATPIETAICSDMLLAQLDRRTAEAFSRRLRFESVGTQASIRAQQQAWLAQRDTACSALTDQDLVACLKEQCTARLIALRTFA